MCGRATLTSPVEDIAELFDAPPIDIGPPRFNIAPSQPILTVRSSGWGSAPCPAPLHGFASKPVIPSGAASVKESPSRQLALVRWGLIPWWARPDEMKKIASRCIQARAETVTTAPAFRDAFRRHRCLVVFDGFFEWKTLPDGRRIPHHVRRETRASAEGGATPKDETNGLFAVAGLWDSWRPQGDQDADAIESCAVVTTRSGGIIRDLHTRMPLVLDPSEWDLWLGPPEDAAKLLEGTRESIDRRARDLVVTPVSTWVNDVKHDDPRCVEPAPIAPIAAATPRQMGFSFTGPVEKKRRAR